MIESEEKRERIIDILERWSKNCKIDHLLRDGDIAGLASWILEEFYHIWLACGHGVKDFDEEVVVEFDEPYVDEEGFRIGRITGSYCKECAEWFMKNAKNCIDKTEEYKVGK